MTHYQSSIASQSTVNNFLIGCQTSTTQQQNLTSSNPRLTSAATATANVAPTSSELYFSASREIQNNATHNFSGANTYYHHHYFFRNPVNTFTFDGFTQPVNSDNSYSNNYNVPNNQIDLHWHQAENPNWTSSIAGGSSQLQPNDFYNKFTGSTSSGIFPQFMAQQHQQNPIWNSSYNFGGTETDTELEAEVLNSNGKISSSPNSNLFSAHESALKYEFGLGKSYSNTGMFSDAENLTNFVNHSTSSSPTIKRKHQRSGRSIKNPNSELGSTNFGNYETNNQNIFFEHLKNTNWKSRNIKNNVSLTNGSVKSTPINSTTREFSCNSCGKQYCRKSTLKIHMKQHMGDRPFICNICDKSFSQAANLTAHKRVHTGEKPFRCTICFRPFSQSSSLVTHKRTHTGERPYSCMHCAKSFTDSSTLTKHLRTHTGQKPYSCHLCMMQFSQSGNLHRHMKTHVPE